MKKEEKFSRKRGVEYTNEIQREERKTERK